MSYLHSLSSCRTWTAQWRYWRSFSSCRAMRRRAAWGCACAGDFGPCHLDDFHHVEAFVAGTKSITWINKHRKHSYFLHILKQIFKAESLWFLQYPVWNSGNKLLSFNLLLNYCINSWGEGTEVHCLEGPWSQDLLVLQCTHETAEIRQFSDEFAAQDAIKIQDSGTESPPR